MNRLWPLLFCFLLVGCSTLGGLFSSSAKPTVVEKPCAGDDCEAKQAVSPWRIYDDPVVVKSETVEFGSGPGPLKGTIVRPQESSGPLPGIVIVHDTGPYGRDGIIKSTFTQELPVEVPIYLSLSEELAAAGFVVLTYDKRTCVQGRAPWCTYPASYLEAAKSDLAQTLTDDAHAALSYVAARSDVDPQKLVVIGHGQGASLALNLPAQPQVSVRVLLTPSAYGPDDVVLHQTETSLELVSDAIRSRKSSAETDEMQVRKGELAAALKAQTKGFEALRNGTGELSFLGLDRSVWLSLLAIHKNGLEALAKPGPRTLIIVGEDDVEYPDDNAAALEPRMSASVRLIEMGINHALVDLERDPTVLSRDVKDSILTFISSTPNEPSPDTGPEDR